MIALLINPELLSVVPIEISSKNYISELKSRLDSTCLERYPIKDEDGIVYEIWVDDDGLFKIDPESVCMFAYKGCSTPLAGKGIILGSNTDFNEVEDAPITPEQAKALIKFIRPISII